jgi:CRISPR-associated endonuclease/helicase Cas3
MLLAHSQNIEGHWHSLPEHLAKVAALASTFSQTWGDLFWAEIAGGWHDLGKARRGFQIHVQCDPDAHIEGRVAGSDKTHSAAGALHARAEFTRVLGSPAAAVLARPLEYLIAGHHAGLADWQPVDNSGLSTRLGHSLAQTEYEQAHEAAAAQGLAFVEAPLPSVLIAEARRLFNDPLPFGRALELRMLFSALVDADFLDTESHFDAGKTARRGSFPPIARYAEQLQAHIVAKVAQVQAEGRADDPVMQARAEVLAACRAKATLAPGALQPHRAHRRRQDPFLPGLRPRTRRVYGKRRIVYAIPYTSIIEQTADVFARIFGRTNRSLEHHTQAESDESQETTRSRLACENWDAPLVVTTNVQLFESLFARQAPRAAASCTTSVTA